MAERPPSEIQAWLTSRLAQIVEVPPEQIDLAAPLTQFGLDSTTAVSLTGELEDWLGIEVDPSLFAEHPTIEKAAEYLADLGETTL